MENGGANEGRSKMPGGASVKAKRGNNERDQRNERSEGKETGEAER